MKKIIVFLFTAVLFFPLTLNAAERYIVFFTETAEIPDAVADKMLRSKRFCMTVPVKSGEKLPDNIEELVSYGKIELSMGFLPEPVLPILASVFSTSNKKSDKQSGFSDYVTRNLDMFSKDLNKGEFGIFLDSAEVSHNILYYFAGINLPWINIDNAEEDFNGVYKIDGVSSFALYKNFPTSQKSVMKWLESKKENILPVLLTKKHLNNTELMNYVIDLFDGSKYIKPAVPLYAVNEKGDMILPKKTVSFSQVQVKNSVMAKLYTAVSYINDYKDSSDFNDYSYFNAQSELVYLCSYDLLKGLGANKTASQRMFDAAYNNIFRLIGSPAPDDKDMKAGTSSKAGLYAGTEEVFQSEIKALDNGAVITNDGIIKELTVTSKDGNIKIKIDFEGGAWNEKAAFVDIYIDMNNLDGAGSTMMLPGISGYLTPESGWEYAVRIDSNKALLYRHSAMEGAVFLAEIPVSNASVTIPQKYIRGNPRNWGFQAVVVTPEVEGKSEIIDFLNGSSQSRNAFLSVKPFQIPAVRVQ